MGGMTITDERKRFMDVSDPYFDATQALMAKKGGGVASLDDVKSKKLKLGSQAAPPVRTSSRARASTRARSTTPTPSWTGCAPARWT